MIIKVSLTVDPMGILFLALVVTLPPILNFKCFPWSATAVMSNSQLIIFPYSYMTTLLMILVSAHQGRVSSKPDRSLHLIHLLGITSVLRVLQL